MRLRLFFTLLFSWSSLASFAQQAAGIQFAQGNWEELIALAEKEQRPIFVDVYTDWCGPCKLMDATVFKEKEVGTKFNKAFISYKLNAEKGEGPSLAKQFNVNAYPTFLFLNSSGFLLHKVVGEKETPVFLAAAEEALKKAADKDQLGNLDAVFKAGNRQPSFLRKYIAAKAALDMDNTDAFAELMKALPADSLKTTATLLFIGKNLNGLQTPALQWLMRHYNTLGEEIKQQIRPRLYRQLVDGGIDRTLTAKRLLEYEQLSVYVQQLAPFNDMQMRHLNRLAMLYGNITKNDSLLKQAGYKSVGSIMDIPDATVKAEDAKRYNEIMAPFRKGEKDSTKIPGFEEERVYLVSIYSHELTGTLYEVATLFAQGLPAGDPARKDALKWAERVRELMPGTNGIGELIEQLKK